jgi:hypothetical protein
MFCPLCQAEYRQGFVTCDDCRVDLVASREEATASSVQVWQGERQSSLDKILAALDANGIRAHFEEQVDLSLRMRVLGMPLAQIKPTIQYAVWVLRADLERAREAIGDGSGLR